MDWFQDMIESEARCVSVGRKVMLTFFGPLPWLPPLNCVPSQWSDPQLNRNFWPLVNCVSWVLHKEWSWWKALNGVEFPGYRGDPTAKHRNRAESCLRLGAHFIGLLGMGWWISWMFCRSYLGKPSKHLKGRSGPRVRWTGFFSEFLNSFVGRKID